MTDFLRSLKGDLLDRRLLPILAVLAVALLAAVAYAEMGGGSSASTPASAASSSAARASGLAVSQVAANPDQPVAETTNGSAQQRTGPTRDPFVPLAVASSASKASSSGKTSSSATSTASGSQTGSTTSSKSTGGSSGGTTTTPAATTPKSSSPAPPQTVYKVAVRFGSVPPGTPPQSATLKSYGNLTRQQPLPSSKQPLIVFRGVLAGGKSATFTLVGEAILRGSASCLPSASQCRALELKPGQSEELEYLPPGGSAVTYQLQLVSIDSGKASAAAAHHVFSDEAKGGLALLRRIGLIALPGLRYASARGVLVRTAHAARAPRAHAGRAGRRRRH